MNDPLTERNDYIAARATDSLSYGDLGLRAVAGLVPIIAGRHGAAPARRDDRPADVRRVWRRDRVREGGHRMTETTVAYHVEDGVGRPAINVKDRHAGMDYHLAMEQIAGPLGAALIADSDHVDYPETFSGSRAIDTVISDFWQAAQEIATQRGLGEIAQGGRSGGWLVFTDGRDPKDPDTILEHDGGLADYPERDTAVKAWLAGYRAMVEWADAWIADAPRKVASLAQQYAMDEAGEAAARRMFATFRAVRA